MKVSISLPDKDVAFLDTYAKENGLDSRSAAVHSAVRALLDTTLETEYAEAFAEWEGSEDEAFWDTFAADGLGPEQGAKA
jgi:Arc/MetJ-type ribon-helix-helix transcriptional regulator